MNNYYTWGEIQIEACKKMFLNNNAIVVTDLPVMKEDNKYKWYLNAMPHAANEAIYEIIKRGKKHTKQHSFTIVENKGLVLDKKEPFSVVEDIVFEADNAKAYSFEVNDACIINIYVDNNIVETINVDTNNKYKRYKGVISNPNNKKVKIEFKKDNYYLVRNLGLYEFDYEEDEIPTNTNLLIVNLADEVEDFYRIAKVYYQNNTEYQELINNTDYQMINNYEIVFDNTKYGNYIIEYQNYPVKIDNNTLDTEFIELEKETAALIPLYIASQLYKDDDIAIATTYRNEFEASLDNTKFNEMDDLKFVSRTGWL